MRKRLINQAPPDTAAESNTRWLALGPLVTIELTSENAAFPIESVFGFGGSPGWRAAFPGPQTIRILFDSPQWLRRIWLRFCEAETERTQEFTLRYAEAGEVADIEIVRQQWHFSPGGSTLETEDYQVDLPCVSVLELSLDPDQRQGGAVASLAEWWFA